MKIIFAGTPAFTLPVLNAVLSSGHDVVAILTRADRPAGRGLKERQSAVKQEAVARGLRLEQPEQFTRQTIDKIAALQADLMITMSYGMLLPDELLQSLSIGCVNIHTSLLPRWRGAAPIVRAIEAGDAETGVSLMHTVSELDAGPIIGQHRCPITDSDTTQILEKKLAALGAEEISRLLNHNRNRICQRIAQARNQPDTGITYAKKLNKQEAWIDWHDSAHHIACKIRAYNPWPIAQTYLGKQILRIWSARLCNYDVQTAQLKAAKHSMFAGCADGALELLEVQLPGGKPMSASAFVNGHKITDTSLAMHDTY